jgi:hypothetical protein
LVGRGGFDEARRLIQEHKAELLRALSSPPDEDCTPEDLEKLDDLLRQLAKLEGWPPEALAARLEQRRRMAPVNVMPSLRALQKAVEDALAMWPDPPSWPADTRLCRLVH